MLHPTLAVVGTTLVLSSLLGLAEASSRVVSLGFGRDASKSRQLHTTRFSPSRRRQRRQKSSLDSLQWDGSGGYYINVTIGTPGQTSAVYLDTGSSDLWLPSTAPNSDFCQQATYGCGPLGGFDYTRSSSFAVLNIGNFGIRYGDGTEIQGTYFTDVLGIGSISLHNQTMALARAGQEQYPINGIMGVGYDANESPIVGHLAPGGTGSNSGGYANVISTLKAQGHIHTLAYSLYLNDPKNGHGTILFGGIDTDRFHGSLSILPIQPDPQSGNTDAFFVSMTGISWSSSNGSSPFNLSLGRTAIPVLLDSGTTLTYLPDRLVSSIYSAFEIEGDASMGPLIPCNSPISGNLTYTFGLKSGPHITVPFSQLIVPLPPPSPGAGPNPMINGAPACQFGIMGAGDSRASNNQAIFLLGDTFLQSAYVVYDLENNQIGLANANFNPSGSHVQEITARIPGTTIASVLSAATLSVAPTGTRWPTVSGQTSGTLRQTDLLTALAAPTAVATFPVTSAGSPSALTSIAGTSSTSSAAGTSSTSSAAGTSPTSSAAGASRTPPMHLAWLGSGAVAAALASLFGGAAFVALL